jgi:hypothetical protein
VSGTPVCINVDTVPVSLAASALDYSPERLLAFRFDKLDVGGRQLWAINLDV